MNKDEALKMAIKALQNITESLTEKQVWFSSDVYEAINACKEALEQPAQVTRLEVIDNNGRSYVNYGVDKLEFSYQDDGRTLKLFTNGAGIEQPAQEPVLYIDQSGLDGHATWAQAIACQDTDIPLYTHPNQWQGLTDDEIVKELERTDEYMGKSFFAGVRWAEQALKDKNT